jgi:hypothetical protein
MKTVCSKSSSKIEIVIYPVAFSPIALALMEVCVRVIPDPRAEVLETTEAHVSMGGSARFKGGIFCRSCHLLLNET